MTVIDTNKLKETHSRLGAETWSKSKAGYCNGQTYTISPQYTVSGGMTEETADFICEVMRALPALIREVELRDADANKGMGELYSAGEAVALEKEENQRLRDEIEYLYRISIRVAK